ncbi:TPR repeat-containing protein [Ahrensia sp. R2A130]|nr:TPR repeat-containing protein [Ahrensia sp. R2A130]
MRLYGAFSMYWVDGTPLPLKTIKSRALIAILCMAHGGTHTRAWLQECLWGRSHNSEDRINLRQALSSIRKTFGADFDTIFTLTNVDITLNLDRVKLVGDRRDGALLEGIDISEDLFCDWLHDKREMTLVQSASTLSPSEFLHDNPMPTLAVLPLMSISSSRHESHCGDLIALEVIRSLSRSRIINVISHLSSRQFQLETIELSDVRQRLNVNYAMTGTVRVNGSHVHLEAELLSTKTGQVLISMPFEARLESILAGCSEMIRKISTMVGQAILSASVELAQNTPLPKVPAHALLMSSINLIHRSDLAPFARARRNLEELVERAPNFSIPKAWLAKWYILAIAQNWSSDVAIDTMMASKWADEALGTNPVCSFSLAVDGMIQNQKTGSFDLARNRFDDALNIDPNNAIAWLLTARLHAFVGDGEKATQCAHRANVLSPIDPNRYFFQTITATAHLANDEPEKALDLTERSLASNRTHASTLRTKTIALQQLGRHDEAQKTACSIVKLEPSFSIERYRRSHPAMEYPIGTVWADALADAGIPKT